MSLTIQNTSELVTPDKLRLKILVYALPGTGKTKFVGTVPNVGIAACETGHGQGLLTIADKNATFVTPNSYAEFESFCGGAIFKDKPALALDSLTEMVKTFVKDRALAIPRPRGETEKRRLGIPELDDYGVMGELTRRLLRKLIESTPEQHLIVTATEKYDKADPENGQAETLIGPDLPGAMFLGCTAMFDMVFRMRTRPALRDPKDPKTRYTQRYFLTQPDGLGSIVKSRLNANNQPILDKEEIFDPENGLGTFEYMYNKVLKGTTK